MRYSNISFNQTDKVFLISDLHFDLNQLNWEANWRRFSSIIKKEQPCAIFVLGDFIDAWISANYHKFTAKLSDDIKSLSPTKFYFMQGNRDCLLNQPECETLGMHFLKDPTPIQFGEKRIILTHGDLWCANDKQHQQFRRLLSKPIIQRLAKSLPRRLINHLTKQVKSISSTHKKNLTPGLSEPNWQALIQTANQSCDMIIHGHTHKVEVTNIEGSSIERINLGHWQPNQITYFCLQTKSHISLVT